MTPRGILLGRLFGTDILATPGFFLLLAFYFLTGRADPAGAAAWCIALILALLVHEFGHVFAVRRLTGASSTVVLWMLGGLCVHPPVPSRGRRIAISLMGPAFGFGLGAVAWLAYRNLPSVPGPVRLLVFWSVYINLIWTAANLLPILPLDGGQALHAALGIRFGPQRALRWTRAVSVVTAAVAAGVGLNYGARWAAVLAILLAVRNLTSEGHEPR